MIVRDQVFLKMVVYKIRPLCRIRSMERSYWVKEMEDGLHDGKGSQGVYSLRNQ